MNYAIDKDNLKIAIIKRYYRYLKGLILTINLYSFSVQI